jgi:hypothetical protein
MAEKQVGGAEVGASNVSEPSDLAVLGGRGSLEDPGQRREAAAGPGAGAAADEDLDEGGEDTGRTVDVDWVEVFRTGNDFAAQVAAEEVLEVAGIPTNRHDRRSHSMPAPSSMAGEIGVAVPGEQAERARSLLREAQRDGVLQDDGEILDEAVV